MQFLLLYKHSWGWRKLRDFCAWCCLSQLQPVFHFQTEENHKVAGRVLQSHRLNSLRFFFFCPFPFNGLYLQTCVFGGGCCCCCWFRMPVCDGALFVSWMSNLPSSCLWLPTEKGLLVLCLPGNPSDCCCPRPLVHINIQLSHRM